MDRKQGSDGPQALSARTRLLVRLLPHVTMSHAKVPFGLLWGYSSCCSADWTECIFTHSQIWSLTENASLFSFSRGSCC